MRALPTWQLQNPADHLRTPERQATQRVPIASHRSELTSQYPRWSTAMTNGAPHANAGCSRPIAGSSMLKSGEQHQPLVMVGAAAQRKRGNDQTGERRNDERIVAEEKHARAR